VVLPTERRAANSDVSHPQMPEEASGGPGRETDWLTATISRKLSAHEQEKLQAALELLTRLVED